MFTPHNEFFKIIHSQKGEKKLVDNDGHGFIKDSYNVKNVEFIAWKCGIKACDGRGVCNGRVRTPIDADLVVGETVEVIWKQPHNPKVNHSIPPPGTGFSKKRKRSELAKDDGAKEELTTISIYGGETLQTSLSRDVSAALIKEALSKGALQQRSDRDSICSRAAKSLSVEPLTEKPLVEPLSDAHSIAPQQQLFDHGSIEVSMAGSRADGLEIEVEPPLTVFVNFPKIAPMVSPLKSLPDQLLQLLGTTKLEKRSSMTKKASSTKGAIGTFAVIPSGDRRSCTELEDNEAFTERIDVTISAPEGLVPLIRSIDASLSSSSVQDLRSPEKTTSKVPSEPLANLAKLVMHALCSNFVIPDSWKTWSGKDCNKDTIKAIFRKLTNTDKLVDSSWAHVSGDLPNKFDTPTPPLLIVQEPAGSSPMLSEATIGGIKYRIILVLYESQSSDIQAILRESAGKWKSWPELESAKPCKNKCIKSIVHIIMDDKFTIRILPSLPMCISEDISDDEMESIGLTMNVAPLLWFQQERNRIAGIEHKAAVKANSKRPKNKQVDVIPQRTRFVSAFFSTNCILNDVLIEKFAIPFKYRDLLTLKHGVWVNDEVVNFYGAMLQYQLAIKCQSKTVIVSTHFFSSLYLSTGIYDFKQVRKEVIRTFSEIDFPHVKIFIPINIKNVHWVLGGIDFLGRKLLYYDWKGIANEDYLDNMWRLVVDIADEFGLDIAADWERSNVINKPIQNNDYDCGILTIMYTEHLVAGIPTSNIKEFYCSRYRFKIANSILNGEIEFNERGLNNYNNNLCYIISTLQIFKMIKPLHLLAKENSDKVWFKEFYNFMSELLLHHSDAVDPRNYFKYLIQSKIEMLKSKRHEDQMDFFGVFIQHLMGVLNNDSWNNALIDMSSISAVQQFLIDMFYITSMQTISCSCGKVLSEQIHRDVFLKIPITETGHLCDIIKRLSHDVAEIDFNYEDCKNDSEHQHKAIKNMDITMWPEVLVANITFWHDLQTYKKFKRDINIESITDDVEIGETVYQVFGICFHIGPKSNRGHYISFARNWEQQGWHRYDDHDVELATVDDIKKQFSIDDSHCHSVWYHRRRTVR